MQELIELVLYSKSECPLCEEMEETIRQVASKIPLKVVRIDITGDEELLGRYGLDIPVLEHNGKVLAKHRTHPATVIAKLNKLRD